MLVTGWHTYRVVPTYNLIVWNGICAQMITAFPWCGQNLMRQTGPLLTLRVITYTAWRIKLPYKIYFMSSYNLLFKTQTYPSLPVI